MTQDQRIQAFATLGKWMCSMPQNTVHFIATIAVKNPWYTKENVCRQFANLGSLLSVEKLQKWTAGYSPTHSNKTITLILAGNIPLVGFHDILSVLISGFRVQIKPSSEDADLTRYVLNELIEIEPEFKAKIQFVNKLEHYDAVIATGSNNSARYFEYYFGNKPHIIRKNRNSIGVIGGKESHVELTALGHDILDFFGLGCRSVSKLFVPKAYDVRQFFEAIEPLNEIRNHFKYLNNYDFNKSIYLVNGEKHYDNGFLLLKADQRLASPLAVVHFEEYEHIHEVEQNLQANEDNIQCVASQTSLNIVTPIIDFGQTQSPSLTDYADNIDTLQFLAKLKD